MRTAPDIVVFSTADWATRYWTNKQHVAVNLASSGHRVLYVETVGVRQPRLASGGDVRRLATRLRTGVRGLIAGPRLVRPNLWVLSPAMMPWGRNLRLVRRLNRYLLRFSLMRFLKDAGFSRPEVWTYHPFVRDILQGFDTGPLSYHCVDDVAAIPGVDATRFEQAEAEILKTCDTVFVTARPLEKRARQFNDNVHFFPNVVDAAHFGAAFAPGPEPEDLALVPKPRLGYHGTLSAYKIDVDLLRGLAERRPDWHVVLIGDEPPGQSGAAFAALRRLANVHFLGGKDYHRLPAYLRSFDVGLLPMLRNRYTASMYPMKYHEYLASGVPVVSTALPFSQDAQAFLEIGDGVEDFVAAIERQLARGRLSPQQAAAAIGDNTWQKRQELMLEITARAARRLEVAA